MAKAGSMLPSGIGSVSSSASSRQTTPSAYSTGVRVSAVRRGRSSRSARTSQGVMRRTSAAKSARASERRAMNAGNQGGRPSASCAASTTSGAPSTADVPGGTGSTFGKANTNSRAASARSPSDASRSPTVMRSRLSSCASL
jgi:hypothetical protein